MIQSPRFHSLTVGLWIQSIALSFSVSVPCFRPHFSNSSLDEDIHTVKAARIYRLKFRHARARAPALPPPLGRSRGSLCCARCSCSRAVIAPGRRPRAVAGVARRAAARRARSAPADPSTCTAGRRGRAACTRPTQTPKPSLAESRRACARAGRRRTRRGLKSWWGLASTRDTKKKARRRPCLYSIHARPPRSAAAAAHSVVLAARAAALSSCSTLSVPDVSLRPCAFSSLACPVRAPRGCSTQLRRWRARVSFARRTGTTRGG